jgi:hypothetical protein
LRINQGWIGSLPYESFRLNYAGSQPRAYDPLTEYQRLKLIVNGASRFSKPKWRVTNVNQDYRFCATYPSTFVVPAAISDKQLWEARGFRAKHRVPAAVYLHENGASISRCSQPMVGLRQSRSVADERLMAAIKKCGTNSTKPLYFVDCRPQTSAFANLAIGGGFESSQNYGGSHMFMGVENIHAVRESLRRVFELCRSTAMNRDHASGWYSQLENTRWLEHIRSLLSAGSRCARIIEEGSSIVLHCSDGW